MIARLVRVPLPHQADFGRELSAKAAAQIEIVEDFLERFDGAPMMLAEALEDIANEYLQLAERISEQAKLAR